MMQKQTVALQETVFATSKPRLHQLGPFSFSPDVANALVGHCGVDDGVGDRAMAHERLQRPCIDSTGRQGVASSMPQHVSMDREPQLSGLTKPFNQLLSTVDRKRCFPLGQEHEIYVGMLAPESPQ
jgi:hypothetical protein